ncbi:MAG: Hpt domain-containing protein, partial [Gemmatimonadota bacterium]|nr:Hpt domain-containing protein [Gemmatimonadota bacterium]
MDLSKYADLFLSEGREHVAELGGALAELEHSPSSTDAIAAAFRAVHSIKGMAAAMGYVVVTERADAMESALEGLRSGEDRVTTALLTHMIEESDALAQDIEIASAQMTASGGRTADTPGTAGISAEGPIPRRAAPAHVRVRATRLDDLMNLVGEIEIERARMEIEIARVA